MKQISRYFNLKHFQTENLKRDISVQLRFSCYGYICSILTKIMQSCVLLFYSLDVTILVENLSVAFENQKANLKRYQKANPKFCIFT